MGKISQDHKSFLNMAGEFLVAAELNRRKVQAAITYGTSKSADVWSFDAESNRAIRVEVKTTGEASGNWVVGDRALVREAWDPDLFWVLVLLPSPHPDTADTHDELRGKHSPRFFVFSSEEMGRLMSRRDDDYRSGFRARHGVEFAGPGVLKVPFQEAAPFENLWRKIESRVRQRSGECGTEA